MGRFARWLRGALGTAAAWAVVWSPLNTLFNAVVVLSFGFTLPAGSIVAWLTSGAVVGFTSGLVFSAAFTFVNRDRTLGEVGLGRSTALGAMAGVFFPLLYAGAAALAGVLVPIGPVVVNLALGAVLGGGSAHALVKIAHSAGELTSGGDGPPSLEGETA